MNSRMEYLVSDLCYEIDFLKAQLEKVRAEADYYKKEYNNLLSDSLQHSQTMMLNMLDVLLTEGVTESFVNKSK